MFTIFAKAYGLLRDWTGGVLSRLAAPGGFFRLVCAILAALCVFGALHAWEQRSQIHQLQIAGLKCEAEVRGNAERVAGWDAAIEQIRSGLIADALEREAQLERSRLQAAESRAAREEAEARADAFREQYESRGGQCRIALELLDTECAELGGY